MVFSEIWLEKTIRAVRFNIMAGTKDSNFNIMWNLFDLIILKIVQFSVTLIPISGLQP
jgi:hypothetical protein